MKTTAQLQAELHDRAAEDAGFRARLLDDPGSVLREELGVTIPDGVTVHVHEEDGANAHMVLPRSARLSEAEMASVSGGTSMLFW